MISHEFQDPDTYGIIAEITTPQHSTIRIGIVEYLGLENVLISEPNL